MSRTIRDAANRPVQVGDVVGGTTLEPSPVTITGEVDRIARGQVRVKVATTSARSRKAPVADSVVWLPARRMFLIHGAVQRRQLRVVRGSVISMCWSGKTEDLPHAREFVGTDLIGAVEDDDGYTLLIRAGKHRPDPDLVPPGWFILCALGHNRRRVCEPAYHAATFPTAAPDSASHSA